ncbi:lipopolysaccharide biosynthesis protein [Seonamhaeicola marinus]|uniref:Oligosaccharide flippase family protein n=1 Tax=Seonamhaeicola marinus TaxID=1912246 RepID=A0A5D0HKJ8_9FLAO|nr:polysaccharide biosynthesis C-terminal domain-containing protein [Seonamhaeicola marinus]TYA71836.1 oligosaccharide flippase family protein [Seonamhaeicola marinus]
MGIVATQSLKNMISTYIGFLVGAINTLFLYTEFMTDEYYGLVGYMLSAAYVMMPLMSFGIHNTLIKFYSSFKTRDGINSFLTLMVLLPLVVIIPLGFIGLIAQESIQAFLSSENTLISGYIWHTFLIATALAYFEVFFALAKVHMKTVFGNLMKEVFHRVGATLLLVLLYFKILNIEQFLNGLALVYVLRMLMMMTYSFSIKLPVFNMKRIPNLSNILKYSSLIVIAGLVTSNLLDIDKVMLGKLLANLDNIAYYNVGVFIATVIAVPQRSMHQILMPITAKFLNTGDKEALKDLYIKSSLNLFIVSGLIFLLIILNINELYSLIDKEYSVGLYVVLLISVAKLYDGILGSNNAILFNSDYYRFVLVSGVLVVIIMLLLNILLIPTYGINGAAFATLIAIFLYDTVKLYFVWKYFKLWPFTKKSLKIAGVVIVWSISFYFWDFSFHPLVNIALKSMLVCVSFVLFIYKLNLSDDISVLLSRVLRKLF